MFASEINDEKRLKSAVLLLKSLLLIFDLRNEFQKRETIRKLIKVK
jgi:hypothetical protein